MKRNGIILISIFLAQVCPGGSIATAQMTRKPDSQVTVAGWADDSHYLISVSGSNGESSIRSVDIKSGRSKEFIPEKSGSAILNESLPEGVSIDGTGAVSPDFTRAVINKDNDLYLVDRDSRNIRRLTNDAEGEVNISFSPDGGKIAYTKNRDLYFCDLTSASETRLTFDASARIYNGYSSWVYMEEILGRESRYSAFWWSPDGSRIAYLRTDESDVPLFTLNRLDEADGVHGMLEQVPYPKAGDPNPVVRMGVADISTGKTVWVKTDESIDQYLGWPFWTPDGSRLAIQVINRDQNDLTIILADPMTGDFKEIYNEKHKTWVEFYEKVHVMSDGSGFIVLSYRNGWENLCYQGWDGKLISNITDFDFRVTSLDRVDEVKRIAYFSATGDESTDTHFFKAGLDGKNLVQITKGSGTHKVSISPGGSYFIDTWNSITDPGSIIAYDKNGRMIREIYKNELPPFDPELHSRSELVFIKTSDSLFRMPAIITYPVDFDASVKYPVVFKIYGGPDRKNVVNEWKGISPSWYSQNGIVTFTVDHRGSGHFGKAGMDYMYHSLGKWEILDYSDAVRWLISKQIADRARIGITGSSYGGYLTCLALTRGADFWTHGFAQSSVTDFRLYDNVYTERFMGRPAGNPGGYRDGSALTWAGNYKGRLYIVHGDADDNVHLQNSIQLISKLQDAGKSFDFMLYPGNRHGFSMAKAIHSRNEEYSFWLHNFFGKD